MELIILIIALMFLFIILAIPITLIAAVASIFKNKKNKGSNQFTQSSREVAPINIPIQSIYSGKYSSKPLLTKTEHAFYTVLKPKCDNNNLLICPKVRLEDFIKVTAQDKNKYRGRIKSRHVDFLICDSFLQVKAGIELDDPSHNTYEARVTDEFKNELYKVINIPLYRIKTNNNYEEKIDKMISDICESKKEE